MKRTTEIFLAIIITIAASYLIVNMILQSSNNTIILNDIEDTHYEYILKAMMELKPEYTERINEITFSGNQTWIADQCRSEKKIIYKSSSYLRGCHYSGSNRIFIYVSADEKILRKTLCHEILHEIMDINGEEEEDIVYMIDDSGVCYRDKAFNLKIEIEDYNVNENSTIKIEEQGFIWTGGSIQVIGSLTDNSSLKNEN